MTTTSRVTTVHLAARETFAVDGIPACGRRRGFYSETEDGFNATHTLTEVTCKACRKTAEFRRAIAADARLIATVVQAIDFYGNTTQFIIQTVRTEEGDTSFITQVNAQGRERFILPPKVLATIDRQRNSNTTRVRRRHGRRIAADRAARGELPAFLGKRKGGKGR